YMEERRERGEEITPQSTLFATRLARYSKSSHLSAITAREIMSHLVKKAGIARFKTGERFDKAAIYGFRKRFNTTLKTNNDINYNIAEKLMAHKNGLDGVYLKPTREQCFAEFVKAIPELTINLNPSSNLVDPTS
ncbi:MAG: site-specific integrase, partial [Patescibacteria group bacterium]|nr:site-specific integrase [Patescibacteria group bacterium]